MRDIYYPLTALLAIVSMVTLLVVNNVRIEEMHPGEIYIIHALSCLNEVADASTMTDPDQRFVLRLPKECLPGCYPFVKRVWLSDWSPSIPKDIEHQSCTWESMP